MGCLTLTYPFVLLTGFLLAEPGRAHPVTWSPSGQDLQVLQHLLDRLREKIRQEEAPGRPDYEAGGANEDGDYPPDFEDGEIIPSHLPELQDSLSQAQWRKFLLASRRYFSGCFGIRLDRIGTQTGLGCKPYKPRRSTFEKFHHVGLFKYHTSLEETKKLKFLLFLQE
ncbi:natriuretic peptides B-like [Ahaetulla prasina]|uniref:natriuretic peptides B-like n=1 Tax=Ahaetulla prasina TaxID=499056 RepID=UPI00264A1597|nr:natriuretic peptides B-like [Ahaetulla prasina]